MIGIDTSHCEIFARLLNDKNDPHYIKGARVTKAIPFYSPELPISADRTVQLTEKVKMQYDVEMVEDVAIFCEKLDGILLTAVDGSTHLEWIRKLAPYQIPIFIDKPITFSSEDLREIRELAETYQVPLMSSSSLRFAESFIDLKEAMKEPEMAYIYGPLPMQEGIPGYFWYGIHMVEMAVALMGTDIKHVQVDHYETYELCHMTFKSGSQVIMRGEDEWHHYFGIVGHTSGNTFNAEIWKDEKPYYASLLEKVIAFFQSRVSPVPWEETEAVVSIIEKINIQRTV